MILQSIWAWLVFGVLASAAIQTWVPPSFFQQSLAWGGLATNMAVLAISLPLYVCATASVPIAAALVAGGMPPGAALIFLMAGPATNVATMGAVLRGFGARILGIYLATIILCSMGAAQIFDSMIDPVTVAHTAHGDHSGPVALVCAVALLVLLAKFALDDLRRVVAGKAGETAPEALEMAVEGMTCNGCVNRLEGVLRAVEGVSTVQVTLEPGQVKITGSARASQVESAIEEAGFHVRSVA
jgi:copper chaperone CopZ